MTSWMMNKRPMKGFHYVPTNAEHVASISTHAIMVPVAVIASITLMMKSTTLGMFCMATVYGFCLITLFSVSTAFHVVFYLHKDLEVVQQLRKTDRAAIYLFIASSYSPWLFLVAYPDGFRLLSNLKWLIWFFAIFGVGFELTVSRQYPVLGIVAYVMYGVIPALILESQITFPGIHELKFAGAMYLLGVLFFKSEGIVPFAHAIWHICVIFGASIHYVTVYGSFYSASATSSSLYFSKVD